MNETTFLHFIGGRFVDSESGRHFEKRSPVDGSLIGEIAEGGPPEILTTRGTRREPYVRGPWRR